MTPKPTVADRVFAYLAAHPRSSARQVAAGVGVDLVSAKNSLFFLKNRRNRIHESGTSQFRGHATSLYTVGPAPQVKRRPSPAGCVDPVAALHAMQRAAQQHQQFRRP